MDLPQPVLSLDFDTSYGHRGDAYRRSGAVRPVVGGSSAPTGMSGIPSNSGIPNIYKLATPNRRPYDTMGLCIDHGFGALCL